jgi:hypothetical protein
MIKDGPRRSSWVTSTFALRASVDNLRLHSRAEVGGEGQNRTVDTTIFSRMLYQLSYLATRGSTQFVNA